VSILLNRKLIENSRITVDVADEIGAVNRDIFGGAFNMEISNGTNNPYLYSEFGAGIYNPVTDSNPDVVVGLLHDMGITVNRYMALNPPSSPEIYSWANTVDPDRDEHHEFGTAEQIATANFLGVDISMVISHEGTDPTSAGELVTFANARGGIEYYELGNEIDVGADAGDRVDEYVADYLAFSSAMKAVDGSIMLGACLRQYVDSSGWNDAIFAIKDDVDFGIHHFYCFPYVSWQDKTLKPNYLHEQFKELINEKEPYLTSLCTDLGKPIAITEFNGYWDWADRLYRVSLGNALVNAEIIKIFLNNPNISYACGYSAIGHGWGNVNQFFNDETDWDNPFILRPNYFLRKLYADHFGTTLLSATVECEVNDTVPDLSVSASKDVDKIYIMITNKSPSPIATDIYLPDLTADGMADVHTLEGDSPEAHNELGITVVVADTTADIRDKIITLTLKKHSFTAVVVDR